MIQARKVFHRGFIVYAAVLAAVLSLANPFSATASAKTVIVALGDSLTAGYLLDPSDAFPVKLEAALLARGHNVSIVNAGVSGDTSSGGLSRLDWSLPEKVDAVIIELGANDALRGIDPSLTRANLDQMMEKLSERGVAILVAGMLAPPNLGEAYAASFNPIYKELSEKYGAVLYPFFLDGVAAIPRLNLADGIHPTPEGVDVIVERILPSVEKLLKAVKADG